MSPPNTLNSRILAADADGIAQAAALILAGQCVAVPTETVYGLTADATSGAAVARVYEAKGRPAFNPLIIHLGSREEAQALAVFDAAAHDLADRFWPGPLTLVLPTRAGSPIAPLATAGLPTVALRMPAHPVMRALLAACGRPLAAPSANASGRISPTTAAHVAATLDGRIPMILNGGATSAGLESTIVATEGGNARLLRPGPITAEQLAIPLTCARQGIEAPGQLHNHYSPAKPLALDRTDAAADTWWIGFGPVAGDASLSPSGDLVEAASTLFARLHEADAGNRGRIAVAPIPDQGLGVAINDRLRRAAAAKEA